MDSPAPDEPMADAIMHAPELMRIGAMVQTVASELRDLDVDVAGRERLAELYRRSVDIVKEAVPPDLASELDDLVPRFDSDQPTTSELRLAQAQLVGWLEGLFRGMQVMALRSPPSAEPDALPPPSTDRAPGGRGYL